MCHVQAFVSLTCLHPSFNQLSLRSELGFGSRFAIFSPTLCIVNDIPLRRYVFVLVLTFLVANIGLPAQAATSGDPPTLLGTAGGDYEEYVPTLVEATGRGSAFQALFWSLGYAWPNGWASNDLAKLDALSAVPYIELTAQLDEVIAGSPELDEVIATIKEWALTDQDHRVLIAPFPEPNLSEHIWGGQPEKFLQAFRVVVNSFRSAGLGPDHVRFVLHLNGGVPLSQTYPDYYPGNDFVDIIGFSKINRNDPWRAYDEAFGRHIREIQAELT